MSIFVQFTFASSCYKSKTNSGVFKLQILIIKNRDQKEGI